MAGRPDAAKRESFDPRERRVVEKAVRASRPSGATAAELAEHLEDHRSELTGYCSRMLGSPVEAEDAVQETLMRAWRGRDGFEGRGALRSWLYGIATNVCFDHLNSRRRKAHPIDLSPGSAAEASLGPPLQTTAWLVPTDTRAVAATDPADVAASRDEVRLALIAALRQLPPRQRAVLILREVLRWPAREVADLLGTSVPSVNSALQRARATLAARQDGDTDRPESLDDTGRALVARFVDAFARHDFDALVAVLRDDATRSRTRNDSRHRGSARSLGPCRR
jgi:RNA polymerase sigma-70 factor (ECF subfamily)